MAATLDPLGGANMMGYSLPDEDVDAEHEDDPMIDEKMFIPRHAALGLQNTELVEGDRKVEKDGSESKAEQRQDEGSKDDEDDDDDDSEDDEDDEGEAVGPVKLPTGKGDDSASEANEDEDHAPSIEDPSNLSDSDKDSSDAESDGGAEWEEQSDDRDEDDGGLANNNRCIFCGEDEDHDPSEEYEEYLACSVCGDNAHRQCARDSNALDADGSDAEKWKCPTCTEHALEPEAKEQRANHRRSSTSKLTRDLLPVQPDAGRPGSHSVFNQLIVNDDPLDGSRLLRKRKSSVDDLDESQSTSTKRPKTSHSRSESDGSITSTEDTDEGPEKAENGADDTVNKQAEKPAASPSPKPRPSRPRALKKVENPCVRLLVKDRKSLKLCLRVNPSALSKIMLSESQRKRRRPIRPPEPQQTQQPQPPQPQTYTQPTPFTSSYAAPFYSFHERENDELKSKPYGGILPEADADTSKTLPQASDRERFNEAKRKAEDAWNKKNADNGGESGHGLSQKVAGPASKIQCINFGGYEIDTWYAAPYPEEYSRNRVLYICEFCLKYMNSDYVAWRHKLKCPAKHPPGDEIYRDGSISVFEVDGRKNPVYCQNLCLLAKLFLGSKTLYYDVEPFLFYVMTEYDELGCHFVGYFSKEKRPSSSNNVSCILTLPIHQRKGYGNLLIDFSYLLTRVEKKTGSPEKPLSDMGLVSYRNYWRLVLCYQLRDQREPISIADISKRTGMTADDIVSALEGLRALVRDPVTGTYALRLDYNYFREYIEKWEAKKYLWLNPDCLLWTPYVMGRSNLAHLEHAPPLATIAPREGEETNDQEEAKGEENMEMDIDHDNKGDGRNAKVNGVDPEAEESKPTISAGGIATPFKDVDAMGHSQPHLTAAAINPIPGPPPKTPLAKPPNIPVSAKNAIAGLNGVTTASSKPTPGPPPIPATRFEIYPPLPGTASKRRAGRPPALGRRRTATPASVSRRNTGKSSAGPHNVRNKDGTFASHGSSFSSTGKGAAAAASASKRNTRTKATGRSESEVKVPVDGAVSEPAAPKIPEQTSEAQMNKEMEQASAVKPPETKPATVQIMQDVVVLVKQPVTNPVADPSPMEGVEKTEQG